MHVKYLFVSIVALLAYSDVKAQVKPSPYTYHVTLPKYTSRITVDAYLHGLAHADTFVVTVTKGKLLKILIKEKRDKGNIRVNQIITPNGYANGPYSKSVQYPIKTKGTYKIVVGGSVMQGDDWKGYFTFGISTT